MRYRHARTDLRTHKVLNQSPIREDWNVFSSDLAIQEAIKREGGGWAIGLATEFGLVLGTEEIHEHAENANRYPPVLKTFDRRGERIDAVDFHPAYHHLMTTAKEYGLHSMAWTEEDGGHVAHTVMEYLLGQIEGGVCCPITMTYAVLPALKNHPGLYDALAPKLRVKNYDPRMLPISEKTSITMGMAMTEKQGGSDVRANTTRAIHIDGDRYHLFGHKWFCSAPMSDAFLTLAQTQKGLSCFYVPRWTDDGERNPFYLLRLKDKLGNRSNASAEIEYDKTMGICVGEPGRGVQTIIEMVHHTRLDCAMAAVGIMRRAIVEAVYHCRYRSAFGGKLIEMALMKNVLADMIVEQEAALIMVMRIARAYDSPIPAQKKFSRLAVAIAKYWTNKRCSTLVNEAMECLGGGGYIEESILARLYREAPLNGIWEGSGNVICLDVLRSIKKSPQSLEIFFNEVNAAFLSEPRLALRKQMVMNLLKQPNAEHNARLIVEHLALLLQGALVIQYASPEISEAFIESRLSKAGFAFGTLNSKLDIDTIIDRYSHIR